MPRLDLDSVESPVPSYATPRRAETKDASPCSSSRRRRHGVHRSRSASPPRRRREGDGSPRRRDNTLVQSALAYWSNLWANFQDANLDELFEFEARHFEAFDPDIEEHTHDHHALHRRYRDLYERALERHLKTTLGATPQKFYAALERDAADGDSERRSTALAFLAVVRKADDYALFAASMREATKHARWLEEPD